MGYVMADIFAARGNIAKKYAFPYMGDTFATKVSSGEFMIDKSLGIPVNYTLSTKNIGTASSPIGMDMNIFLQQFDGVNILADTLTPYVFPLEGLDGGTIKLYDSDRKIKTFQTPCVQIQAGGGVLSRVSIFFNGVEYYYVGADINAFSHNGYRSDVFTSDGTSVPKLTIPSGGKITSSENAFIIGRQSIMKLLEHYIGKSSGSKIKEETGYIERVVPIEETSVLSSTTSTTGFSGTAVRYCTNGDSINKGQSIEFTKAFTRDMFNQIKTNVNYKSQEVDDGHGGGDDPSSKDDDGNTYDPSDGEGGNGTGRIPVGEDADIPTTPSTSFIACGLNNAYMMNEQKVREFKDWLYTDDILSYLSRLFSSNPMDGIISLAVLPYTPTTINNANIVIAGKQSTVQAPQISLQYEQFEFTYGGLSTKVWGNMMDYENGVKMELYIPFVGVVPLDTNQCIYKKLRLRYIIDNLTGLGTVALYSEPSQATWDKDEKKNLIGYWSFNCRQTCCLSRIDISNMINSAISTVTAGVMGSASGAISGLITTMSQRPQVEKTGTLNACAGYLNGRKPQVIYTLSKLVIGNNQYNRIGRPTYASKLLKDCSGYVRCVEPRVSFNEVNENNSPTLEEMNEINDYLAGGVIV